MALRRLSVSLITDPMISKLAAWGAAGGEAIDRCVAPWMSIDRELKPLPFFREMLVRRVRRPPRHRFATVQRTTKAARKDSPKSTALKPGGGTLVITALSRTGSRNEERRRNRMQSRQLETIGTVRCSRDAAQGLRTRSRTPLRFSESAPFS